MARSTARHTYGRPPAGRARAVLVLILWVTASLSPAVAPAQSGSNEAQRVREVLDAARADGVDLVYSSELVPDSLRLLAPVDASAPPRLRVEAALAPHGLVLREVDGLWVVVRDARGTEPGQNRLIVIVTDTRGERLAAPVRVSGDGLPAAQRLSDGVYEVVPVPVGQHRVHVEAAGWSPAERMVRIDPGQAQTLRVALALLPAELEAVSVSASRYLLMSGSQFFIDQRALHQLPDPGGDPLRAAHRLPGAAAGGLSSRSHFRGGEENETAIWLNGLRLLDPFHIRDYHSIFSSIDANAIAGMEAYTGGFPADYGDRTSGLLLLQSERPDEPRHTELGIGVYNTSALSTGYTSDARFEWLASARRSNLGLVLSDDVGKPDYSDAFAELAWVPSDDTRLAFNALFADDSVVVTTESDPEELEQTRSDTRNTHLWLKLDHQHDAALSSSTVWSWSQLDATRNAVSMDEEQLVADVDDVRDVEVYGLRQEWRWQASDSHALRFGFEADRQRARYDYRADAEYFGFYALYPATPNELVRVVRASPEGERYAAFAADRWRISDATTLEAGLRWDRQTWTEPRFDDQWSPRLSLRHQLSEATQVRLSWGRYHQSQGIHQLQVEDGLDRFFAPQEADHVIAALNHGFGEGLRLRVEAYRKDYDALRPRFENLLDPIPLIPELEPDRVRLDPSSARAEGVEVLLERRGAGQLEWWAHYAWSRASDTIASRREPRSWDQRHALQAGAALERGPWSFGAAVAVHSGWPTTDVTLVDGVPVFGPRNAAQLGTFYTLDFRVARRFDVRIGELEAFLEVTNASNRGNECCVDYDLDETGDGEEFLDRTVDDWLPILPAIGVLWTF